MNTIERGAMRDEKDLHGQERAGLGHAQNDIEKALERSDEPAHAMSMYIYFLPINLPSVRPLILTCC